MNTFTASTLTTLLKHAVTFYPHRTVIECEGSKLNYAELDYYSDAWAAFFQHQGIKLHDRVALILPNLPQFPIVLFGILKAGGVCVHLNPLYTSTELKEHLHDSGARYVIAMNETLPALLTVLPDSSIEHVILASAGDFLGWKAKLRDKFLRFLHPLQSHKNKPKTCLWWSFLEAQTLGEKQGRQLLHHESHADDLILIQYTAGTVSASKGVMLQHKNLLESTYQALERLIPFFEAKFGQRYTDIEIISITAIPLYHIFGLTAGFIALIAVGGCARLVPDPRNNAMLSRALKRPFHAIIGVTTLFNKLLALPHFSEFPFHSLCIACNGGMSLPMSVADRWRHITGSPMIQGYGLTETAAALTLSMPDEQGFTPNYHVGKPLDRTEIQIRHPERSWTHTNEIGEIWVRGPQIMVSYWNRPEETQACFDEERWFNTGDVGFLDASGYLHWVDRKKDIMDISGFMVCPSEIENVALGFHGVCEAVAYSVPHPHQGESIHLAIIFFYESDALPVNDFLYHCQQHLAAYKIPSQLIQYTSLPRNNIGKVRRSALQEHAIAGYPSGIAECKVLKQNNRVG